MSTARIETLWGRGWGMGPVVSLSNLLREETPLIPKRTDDFFPKITPLVYNLLLKTLKETMEEKRVKCKELEVDTYLCKPESTSDIHLLFFRGSIINMRQTCLLGSQVIHENTTNYQQVWIRNKFKSHGYGTISISFPRSSLPSPETKSKTFRISSSRCLL